LEFSMRPKSKLVFFGLAAALTPHFAMGQGQEAVSKILIERAQYWQSKGDYTRAEESWKKLLLIDPKDSKALNGLASINQELSLKIDDKKKSSLDSARSLAKAGDPDKAILKYNAALDNKAPLGEAISLEYYSNLGYTDKGFGAAKEGLQRLRKESPNDIRISLALGKLLIIESGSRVEGIQVLSRLATNDTVGSEATQNWQKALVWIGTPNPKEQPLFDAYLRLYPNDVQIQDQLNAGIKKNQTLKATRGSFSSQDTRGIAAFETAKKALASGDEVMAREELEKSLSIDNNNTWARLELARLYLKEGYLKEAKDLMYKYNYKEEKQTEALYAIALFSVDLKEWTPALNILDQIPIKNRTAAIIALQKSAWVHSQIAIASKLTQQGRQPEALAVLAQAEQKVGDNPEMLSVIANAYLDAGEPAHELNLLRKLMSRNKRPTPELQLQYAGILLKVNQDIECAKMLRQLQGEQLNTITRNNFNDLLFTYALRQVDLLRERGDLAAAYDRLEPLLNQRPKDLLAIEALTRLYIATGENQKALDIYKKLVINNTNNSAIKLSAVKLATQIKDYDYANKLLENMLTESPNNSEFLASAARVYREQGKLTKATELYERALAIESSNNYGQGSENASPIFGAVLSNNPFTGLNNSNSLEIYKAQRQIAMAPLNGTTSPNAYMQPRSSANTAGQFISSNLIPDPVVSLSNATPRFIGTAYSIENNSDIPEAGNSAYKKQNSFIPAPATQYNNYEVPKTNRALDPIFSANSTPNEKPPRTIITELNEIKQDRSPEVLFGAQIRNRKGSSGTNQLTDVETPFEIRFPAGDGKANVQITPISLNAGTLGADYYSSSTFGGGPQAALNQMGGQYSENPPQTASGLGIALGYKTQDITVDAGVTPLGFMNKNFTGGVKLNGNIDDAKTVAYQVNISSRPVTDSLLSFAGTKDTRTGLTWGGVMSRGGRIQITKDLGGYGIIGAASYYGIDGHNVASNSRSELMGGAYVNIINNADSILSSGLNISNIFYDKNLSNFTYGQGGYFSPQQYYALTVPLTWSQRSEKISFQLRGAIGVQQFTQNASNYFPTNSALQSQANIASAAAKLAGLTGSNQSIYPSQTSTGAAYNLAATGEYQFAPKLFFGANAQADNASNYRQFSAGIYLRYSFEPITGLMPLPVKSYASPYGQ
jgi:tetratricopeptide (TPR) repeat protein